MKHKITLTINGENVTSEVDSRLLLVHFIRENLDLTGTHIGCDTSGCGACTIMLNGQSIKSCTYLAVRADGAEITTIEGIAAEGTNHPMQKAFHDQHGLHCGFCTPGMVIRSIDLLKNNPNPSAFFANSSKSIQVYQNTSKLLKSRFVLLIFNG